MYTRHHAFIQTLAPLHVGASAGEEAGNLNLIFRDAFTQTGVVPGSSIRGRFRAELRRARQEHPEDTDFWFGSSPQERRSESSSDGEAYDSSFREALVKFEYASLLWLPLFCPGQPVVWVSSPKLLKRYATLAGLPINLNDIKKLENTGSSELKGANVATDSATSIKLFFNLGFFEIQLEDVAGAKASLLSQFVPAPLRSEVDSSQLVVVDDASIGAIHDMALYRQSRVKLKDSEKSVEFFFNVEALPEGSILVFPVAVNRARAAEGSHQRPWHTFAETGATYSEELNGFLANELYFGGLESIGFGRCLVYLSNGGVG
ncbi:RAMP superfamily CRISPR-associated protein [Aphanothece minutissima]|uniref:Type III-B CRISPR module RAMP protein Cmr4 n=1 Tax=Aphanothece cf. minutissima CCALA 015 TaxID=2107695 RepID=A0ABX5FC26_9CHRO|nr:RAMP superfamily CRISPR-associated protein [Aphanothece minutissima]PSB39473.1 type III-B CRISPR module RAMP protein Cmr4 [Aphanothece cf. minutissima CCALA 015]